jgi:hypothetical protein
MVAVVVVLGLAARGDLRLGSGSRPEAAQIFRLNGQAPVVRAAKQRPEGVPPPTPGSIG